MKKAEEYRKEAMRLRADFDWNEITSNEFWDKIESLFDEAQKDAYNQAIMDVAESAECDWDGQENIERFWVDKESINKLMKWEN